MTDSPITREDLGSALRELRLSDDQANDVGRRLENVYVLFRLRQAVTRILKGLAGSLVAVFVATVVAGLWVANTALSDVFGRVPVGSIIAWHETPDNVTLDKSQVGPGERWMRCNNQEVTDKDSPFYKQRLPDLNGAKRFLRGGKSSGHPEPSMVKQHQHKAPTGRVYTIYRQGGNEGIHGPRGSLTFDGKDSTGDMKSGGGNETRPINMAVVWIIRVK
jgi:hypothetical protein